MTKARILFCLLCGAALILAGCAGSARQATATAAPAATAVSSSPTAPVPSPTATPPPASAAATPPPPANPTNTPLPASAAVVASPQGLLGANLLTLEGVESTCDQPDGAVISCTATAHGEQLSVDVHADTFARWRLTLPAPTASFTGSEVLTLRLSESGGLAPHLYFGEEDGRRVLVNVDDFRLPSDPTDHPHPPTGSS